MGPEFPALEAPKFESLVVADEISSSRIAEENAKSMVNDLPTMRRRTFACTLNDNFQTNNFTATGSSMGSLHSSHMTWNVEMKSCTVPEYRKAIKRSRADSTIGVGLKRKRIVLGKSSHDRNSDRLRSNQWTVGPCKSDPTIPNCCARLPIA